MLKALVEITRDSIRYISRSYRQTFNNSPWAQDVLIDLARFCRANETCVVPGDHDRTLMLEGRREVWLRIANRLNLNPEQLYALYAGDHYNPMENKQ